MINLPVEGFLRRYKQFFPAPAWQQISYAEELYTLISSDTDTRYVTVSNGRCGLGKSTFVKTLISYCTIDDAGKFRGSDAVGLIIVTDMIQRANEYLHDDAKRPYPHDRYCAFITSKERNPKHLAPSVQLALAQDKPVIILTSQRFFSMDEKSREALFLYKLDGDKEPRERKIAIIDEKPYFHEALELRVKNFNDCDTAIRSGIKFDHPDKSFLIAEYNQFSEKMKSLIRYHEQNRPSTSGTRDVFFWQDCLTTGLTSNDDVFFEALNDPDIRKDLLIEYPDFFRDMDAFRALMQQGALFIAAKSKTGDNKTDTAYFLLPKDNRDMFYLGKDKAKFFVLDGTADVDPDYALDYVHLVDASMHNVNLPLTINLVDVSTSRQAIVNGSGVKVQHNLLRQDLRGKIAAADTRPLLGATYQAIKDELFIPLLDDFSGEDDAPPVVSGHFGGLRGLNKYKDLAQMAHIGFNRQTDINYYIKYIARHPEELKHLRAMSVEQSRSYICDEVLKQVNGVFILGELNEIMFGSILADFEQNIFRLAIRNYNNETPVTVYAYWNCKSYTNLNEMIRERYGCYGAKVVEAGTPACFLEDKTERRSVSNGGGQTRCQIVLAWLKRQISGTTFTVAELRKELCLTAAEFKSVKKNDAIKNLLNNWSTDQNGIYMVP